MQFAIIASFAALALAAPWKPETTSCSTTSTAAAVTATTAVSAPKVTPISGNGSSDNSGSNSGSASGSSGDLCPALYTPQCCQVDVLGLVGLTCDSPSLGLTSQQSFVNDCAATGSRAQCCILPVAGQAVVCTDV